MWLTMSLSNVFLSSNITQSQLTQMGNFEYGEDIYIFFLFYNNKKKKRMLELNLIDLRSLMW